jgi:hypothetical protein
MNAGLVEVGEIDPPLCFWWDYFVTSLHPSNIAVILVIYLYICAKVSIILF